MESSSAGEIEHLKTEYWTRSPLPWRIDSVAHRAVRDVAGDDLYHAATLGGSYTAILPNTRSESSRAWRLSRRRAAQVLSRIALIWIDDRILESDAGLTPPDLRSLDAIHIAPALSVRDDLAVLVTYDRRLAAAARSLQIQVIVPGSIEP